MREVPAVNTWTGSGDDFSNAAYWTDGVPTSDDILVFTGPVSPPPVSPPPGFPPVPPVPPPPFSHASVTFPSTADLSYAGIRLLNSYGGTVTFPFNVSFGEWTQNSGATSQYADTVVSVSNTFGWVGGAINTSTNAATMKLKGVLMGQIGEDTTSLSSGSKIVLDKNVGGIASYVQQTGVLQLLNDSDLDILGDCTLVQRQILADPPPIAGFEIDGTGNVKVSGRFLSEGGKVPSVKVEPSGVLDVERKFGKGGLTVTGKVPGSDWGVVSRGLITMRNGETLTATHGVAVTHGSFYIFSAFQIAQVATIDGRFSFEGDEIRLGLQNFLEDGTNLGHSNTTLKVTKRTDLLIGDFKPKLDVNDTEARDFIKTDKEFNCEPEFFIKPEAAAPAAGTLVLVSQDGFLSSNNPSNGDSTNFTMARTNDGKKFEVK